MAQIMEQCDICLKQKDKIKYTTERISICQPCEKLLSSTLIENDQIKADILRVAKALLLPPPPIPSIARAFLPSPPPKPIVEHINYVEEAKRRLFGSEGVISLLMGSVFDSTNRQLQINALAKELRDTKLKQYQNQLAEYEGMLLEAKELYNAKLKQNQDELAKYERELLAYNGDINRMINTNIDRIFLGQLTKDLFQKNCTYVGLTKKEFIELSNTSFRLFRAYKLKILTYKRIERLPEIDSKDLNKQILRQDDYKCIICGATNRELHVHHIVPLHRFGTNDPKNMATLCCSCHSRQHPEIKVTHNKKTKRKTKPNTTYPLSFVAFDVETTGLQAELHEIIELAAVKFIDGQHTVNFSRLVKPLSLIPNRIIQLTGITNEMVSNAPPINAVFNEFLNFISDSPLVAYNAPFDLRFIKKHMNSEMINNSVFDSLQMARKAFPLLDDHKLGTVTRHLNLNIKKHHRSYEDSLAAGYIYLEAIKKLV